MKRSFCTTTNNSTRSTKRRKQRRKVWLATFSKTLTLQILIPSQIQISDWYTNVIHLFYQLSYFSYLLFTYSFIFEINFVIWGRWSFFLNGIYRWSKANIVFSSKYCVFYLNLVNFSGIVIFELKWVKTNFLEFEFFPLNKDIYTSE